MAFSLFPVSVQLVILLDHLTLRFREELKMAHFKTTFDSFRRETWSIGYGRRLMFKGRGFESWRHLLAGHTIFSHIFVVRIVMFV